MPTREGKDYHEYVKARNQAKGACHQATQDYENSVAREAKQNPKAFYAHVAGWYFQYVIVLSQFDTVCGDCILCRFKVNMVLNLDIYRLDIES